MSPLYDTSLANQFGYDLTRLSSVFLDLQLEDLDEDGVVEYPLSRYRRDPLVFQFLVSSENAERVATAQAISETLSSVGVSAEVTALPFESFTKALKDGEFDLYLAETTLSADFDPLLFCGNGALSFGSYKNSNLLELWNAYVGHTGLGLASDRSAFWDMFLEEAPIDPVLFKRQALLTQRGLFSNPAPLWDNIFANLPQWNP
jgi:peptide/nickel transport system substrate-binding protein